MANQNVRFFFTDDRNKFEALSQKDPLALYFIEDKVTGYRALYKGNNLIAVGITASQEAAGLMSAADKRALDNIVANPGGVEFTTVDGTITIDDGADGKKNIGVAISQNEGNALISVDDGLFVSTTNEVTAPEYFMEEQAIPEDGFVATYKLKKTVNGETTYVGDSVNIPKDKVLQSAIMKTVETVDVPYKGAKVGDKYIDMVFNDENQSHIYVPLGDIGNNVSTEIKINAASANGLSYVDNTGLSLALASAESNGAMSKEMFTAVDDLTKVDIATKDDVKSIVSKTVGTPNAEQFDIDENGVLTLKNVDTNKVIYNGEKLSDVIDRIISSYSWSELPEVVNADTTNAASTIASANSGAVVKMNAGIVSDAISVNKSVTVEGENAGVAQNFSQEV